MMDLNLQDTNIILTLRKHWVVFVINSLGTVIAGLVPLIVVEALAGLSNEIALYLPYLRIVALVWLYLSWLALACVWTVHYLDIWLVTDQHIYCIEQVRLFNRKVRTVSFDRIEEINVRTKGFLQTLFGYGTIEIHTASADEESAIFKGIPHPNEARTIILNHVERLSLLEAENKLLTQATKEQEKLIHLVGHEVKGYLTKSQAALASIVEGDYGAVSKPLQSMAGAALAETRHGVDAVMGMLRDTNAATGALVMEKKQFDFKRATKDVVLSLQEKAKGKKLTFDLFAGEGSFGLVGDESKLRDQVIRNLVENAIHYTVQGGIRMELTQSGTTVRFSIKDTGVGISPETMLKLFTEGGRDEHSTDLNPESTGFGLFVAKRIVDAHGGKIWAESAGPGHGSTFIVELPVV